MKRNPIILAALCLAILAVAACGPQMQTAPPGGYVYGNYGPGPGGFYGTAPSPNNPNGKGPGGNN
jgi:hypothetical protein